MEINTEMKVLVVDDHQTMRRIVKNLLEELNIRNIEEAIDGSEALQKLAAERFDLILSDWNMMPMTGLQLLQFVRNDSNYQHQNVPFIMITGESKVENVVEAKKAGVDNYIMKPFNAETLKSKMIAAITKRQR